MNWKTRLRELAVSSGRVVELARVQSVTGKILNITPVPRRVADPILRSMRRKLEKGGDRQAVRAAFLGPEGPRMRRSSGEAPPQRLKNETDLWKPRVVEIDGRKSLLHYRITSRESHLKPSNAPLPDRASEETMRSHIVHSAGRAISTSLRRASAMRLIDTYGGRTPVEGVYATPLEELIKNQREKTKAAIVNAKYQAEREITQIHGDNLLKVRRHNRIVDPSKRPGEDVSFARLRELAVRSERVVEFSVAWARRLKGLSPEARRRLGALSPQTRQTGGKLGQGADFRVYESFTPGRGHTATKTLIPEALKERDEVMAVVKKSWGDVEASPAGKVAALPVGWHKAGYVQDRMVEVGGRKPRLPARGGEIPYPSGRRRFVKDSFLAKVSPFPMNPNSEWAQMPKGALDSSLAVQGGAAGILAGKSYISHAQNIMLDPRKRRLVLTDPLGWQSSSTQIGALTPNWVKIDKPARPAR